MSTFNNSCCSGSGCRSGVNRCDFLKFAGLTAAAAAISPFVPVCGQEAGVGLKPIL